MNTYFVIHNLVDLWKERLPCLHDYLQATFGYSPVEPLEVTRLFLAQMADGDITTDNMGGVYSLKWVFSRGVLQAVPLDFAYDEMYETDPTGNLYLSPSFLFCHQEDVVLLSERYGPSLKHRVRGHLVNHGKKATIEWKTIWRSSFG